VSAQLVRVSGLCGWSANVDDKHLTLAAACLYRPSNDAHFHDARPGLTTDHVCCHTATLGSCATCTIHALCRVVHKQWNFSQLTTPYCIFSQLTLHTSLFFCLIHIVWQKWSVWNNLNKILTLHRSDKKYCLHRAQITGRAKLKIHKNVSVARAPPRAPLALGDRRP